MPDGVAAASLRRFHGWKRRSASPTKAAHATTTPHVIPRVDTATISSPRLPPLQRTCAPAKPTSHDRTKVRSPTARWGTESVSVRRWACWRSVLVSSVRPGRHRRGLPVPRVPVLHVPNHPLAHDLRGPELHGLDHPLGRPAGHREVHHQVHSLSPRLRQSLSQGKQPHACHRP